MWDWEPTNGVVYEYLCRLNGPLPFCIFTWPAICILKPVSVTIVSVMFGENVTRMLSSSLNSDDQRRFGHTKYFRYCTFGFLIDIDTKGIQLVALVNKPMSRFSLSHRFPLLHQWYLVYS